MKNKKRILGALVGLVVLTASSVGMASADKFTADRGWTCPSDGNNCEIIGDYTPPGQPQGRYVPPRRGTITIGF